MPDPKFVTPEILLHPNIPKPLHGANPRSIMGKEWWDEKRHEAYEENNQCCWACGVHRSESKKHQWLEGHEFYEIDYAEGRMSLVCVVALCHYCHNYIHDGRLTMLVREGKVDKDEAKAIMEHGDAVVEHADPDSDVCEAWTDPDKGMADWQDWRLVIDDTEFGPTTPNPRAWIREEWRDWKPKVSP